MRKIGLQNLQIDSSGYSNLILFMTYNQRNRELLNKQKPYNKMCEEEIEMELFDKEPKYNKHPHYQENLGYYHILHDNKDNHQSHAERRKHEEIPQEKPFNQKIITMNGQTFKLVEHNQKPVQKPKKSKVPTMLVSCHECKTVQSVPGITKIFDCGVCHLRNECVPIYAIFRCCSCNAKVLYNIGSSDFIKCTKCFTVNQIPRNVRQARGASDFDPHYKVMFKDKQLEKESYINPYVRDHDQLTNLQQLLSEDQNISKKYPDL